MHHWQYTWSQVFNLRSIIFAANTIPGSCNWSIKCAPEICCSNSKISIDSSREFDNNCSGSLRYSLTSLFNVDRFFWKDETVSTFEETRAVTLENADTEISPWSCNLRYADENWCAMGLSQLPFMDLIFPKNISKWSWLIL